MGERTGQAEGILTPHLEAAVRKKGYVSGVARQSFLDKKTGFRDPGFGLDIVDWLLEEPVKGDADSKPSDARLDYHYNNLVHGKQPKTSPLWSS